MTKVLILNANQQPLYPVRISRARLLLSQGKATVFQRYPFTICEMFFREDDVMEVDHIIPKSKGGKDEYKNLQLLHRHCHDTKTANDGSPGIKSGCNSAEPKPTRKLEKVEEKWVTRYA